MASFKLMLKGKNGKEMVVLAGYAPDVAFAQRQARSYRLAAQKSAKAAGRSLKKDAFRLVYFK